MYHIQLFISIEKPIWNCIKFIKLFLVNIIIVLKNFFKFLRFLLRIY